MIVDLLKQHDFDPIFTVTTVILNDENNSCVERFGWTFFYSYEEAVDFVTNNRADIFDNGWFSYAVIEKYEPGKITPSCTHKIDDCVMFGKWFKYDHETNTAHEVDCPKGIERIISFFRA